MKYKMFVSDYDGTLGNAPHYIAPETLEAIKKYRERGGIFVVCTGRSLASARNVLARYDFEGDIIASQGAVVADIKDGAVKYLSGIEKNLAAEIMKYIESRGDCEGVMATYNGNFYYSKGTGNVKAYEQAASVVGIEAPDLAQIVAKADLPVQKIMSLCASMDKAIAEIDALYGDRTLVNSGAAGLIEVINPECSKGKTTLMLARSYGVAPQDVLTVGDSSNDLELMGYGFHGVAVGDGSEALKTAAAEVTVPYAQNPVAHLLGKYCL